MLRPRFTRRALIERAPVALAAVLGVAQTANASAQASVGGQLAARPPALTPRRRRAFEHTVEALSHSPTVGVVRPEHAPELGRALAARYTREPAAARANIDVVLDALEEGLTPGEYERLSASQRLELLRSGLRDGEAQRGRPPRAALVEGAIGLALAPLLSETTTPPSACV